MAATDTLPEVLRPLMEAPSIETPCCAVCGRPGPLNRHHIVRRGAGRLYRHGLEVPKPTITLCGSGNLLRDADGRPYCHGLAHAGILHVRWVRGETVPGNFGTPGRMLGAEGGHLEYLIAPEPCGYLEALGMDGWRPLRRWRWQA